VPRHSTLGDIGAALAALQAEAGLAQDRMPTKAQLEELGASLLLLPEVLSTGALAARRASTSTGSQKVADTAPHTSGRSETCHRSLE